MDREDGAQPRNFGRGFPRRNTEPDISTFFTNSTSLNKDEQISCIDREILRVEDSIVKLVLQRAFLKRRRNSFSPAVCLPPEVLALIFEFMCLPNGDGFNDDSHIPDGKRLVGGVNLGLSVGTGAVTPLFLGSICSKWRHVSRGASQLWCTVIVHMDNRHAGAQAALLGSWLKQSAHRRLRVKLVEDDTNDDDNDDDNWGIDVTPTAIIDILASHSQQWHTIDFFLPSTWKHSLSRIQHHLPLLSSATLRFSEGSPTMARVDAFTLAPQLQEVKLVGYSVADVHLPWQQLQRLDGEYFGLDECLDTLRLGTELRTCQFEQLYRGVQPFVARSVRHEYLESLELIMDTSHELNALFGAMTLPNLKELVLSLSDEEPMLNPIIPLIRRSACALQMVHLVGVTPPEEDLIEFLKEVPFLKVLILINPVTESGGKITQWLLDLMDPMSRTNVAIPSASGDVEMDQESSSHAPCLVPMLEKLEYQGAVGFTLHAFVQFLVHRWQIDVPNNTARQLGEPMRMKEGHVTRTTKGRFIDGTIAESTSNQTEPAASQLRSLILTTTKRMRFESADAKTIHGLIKDGMHLDFLDDPNAD
ncbi:hypothetical protein GALMADRAFT_743881 [Galerina marginata CBS 339.88]|uniref:F-box domain-containing protein n=1 Tax=Galerina marginata (strain CBS 339.88) TaxID=685588 RepID=A0A067SPY2_GALM3|nr:hypothetical protein GALMADRAFT_743881 [Galerina marginata CBS 339.88]